MNAMYFKHTIFSASKTSLDKDSFYSTYIPYLGIMSLRPNWQYLSCGTQVLINLTSRDLPLPGNRGSNNPIWRPVQHLPDFPWGREGRADNA